MLFTNAIRALKLLCRAVIGAAFIPTYAYYQMLGNAHFACIFLLIILTHVQPIAKSPEEINLKEQAVQNNGNIQESKLPIAIGNFK